jgi:hypothetical protein
VSDENDEEKAARWDRANETLTFGTCSMLALGLNQALDQGHTAPMQEVYRELRAGTIFRYLHEHEPEVTNWFVLDAEQAAVAVEVFQGVADVLDVRRRTGVENNGLCLLLFYCLNQMDQRAHS